METGIPSDISPEIDAIHSALAQEAAGETAGAAVVETNAAALDAADDYSGPDTGFCRKILAVCLERHANSVRREFIRDLEPVCGSAQAERIAARAAMDDELQSAVAEHGARVLGKYGLARYVSDEAVLVGSVIAYWWELSDARKERDEILKAHGGAAAQTPTAPGSGADASDSIRSGASATEGQQ